MVKTGSKFFFGLAAFAFLAACVYGGASAGDEVGLDTFVGVLTLGYKGSVGDQVGYTVLVALAGCAFFLGCMSAAFRDADAEAQAEVVELETVPEVAPPGGPSYFPIIAAFGAGLIVVGLVVGPAFVVAGLLVIAAMVIEWGIQAWSDRATGDPAVNRSIRNRLMYPVEVPALALIGIAVFVYSVSRILLVIPKTGGYFVFGAVPVLILAVAWLLTARPKVNPNLLTALLLVGGLAVLAGGVVGASLDEREVEPHEEEEEHEQEGGLAPLVEWRTGPR
jgi:hypothetical protein